MPVNVRGVGDGVGVGGNHFVPARFVIPMLADAAACLREVQRITSSWKHAPGLALSDVMATGLNLLPAPLVTAMWGSMLKGDDFCVTNVPGAPFETYLAGSRVERFYAFAPPSGAGLNVSLVTPAGRACIGINVDTAAVPDSAKLATCLEEDFDEIFRLARVPKRADERAHRNGTSVSRIDRVVQLTSASTAATGSLVRRHRVTRSLVRGSPPRHRMPPGGSLPAPR